MVRRKRSRGLVGIVAASAGAVVLLSGIAAAAVTGDQASSGSAANPSPSSPVDVPQTFTPSEVTSPIDKWYYGLLSDFPTLFGGVITNASGSYIVQEVGSNALFEEEAQSRFDEIPAQLGVTVQPSKMALQFEQVQNSLQHLYDVRNQIAQNLTATSTGEPMGVGIDQSANRVHVESLSSAGSGSEAATTTPQNSADNSLVSTYGQSTLEFSSGPVPKLTASRTSDSPPWNGGDALRSGYNIYGVATTCTSGPGLHLSSNGAHLMLLAGHCMYDAQNYADPNNWYNGGNYVGSISAWAIGGTNSGSAYLDIGVIPTSTSRNTWTGVNTRTAMTGNALPPTGGTIFEEGAYGGEQRGTVVYQSITEPFTMNGGRVEWVGDLIQVSGVTLTPGDSGGTAWEASIFGPLYVGANIGTNGSGTSWVEQIGADLYVLSAYYGTNVVVNTVSNP